MEPPQGFAFPGDPREWEKKNCSPQSSRRWEKRHAGPEALVRDRVRNVWGARPTGCPIL